MSGLNQATIPKFQSPKKDSHQPCFYILFPHLIPQIFTKKIKFC